MIQAESSQITTEWLHETRRPLSRVAPLLTDDKPALASLGASVIEDLFDMCDDARFDLLEQAARADHSFAMALACVWRFDNPRRPRLDALLAELGVEPL